MEGKGDSFFIADPMSRIDIRGFATIIRKVSGLEKAESFPVLHFLENCMPLIDDEFSLEYVDPLGLPDKYAETYPNKHSMKIRTDVYERAANGYHLDRFTIAHEIGHYFMHQPDNISLARADKEIKIPTYKKPEWQANTFAGELLVPPRLANGYSIEEVVEHFHVSPMVAKIQLSYT